MKCKQSWCLKRRRRRRSLDVRGRGKCGVTKSFDPPSPSFLLSLSCSSLGAGKEGKNRMEKERACFSCQRAWRTKKRRRKIGVDGGRIQLLISPFTHAGLPTHLNEPLRIKSKCAANFETLSGDNFLRVIAEIK